MFQFSLHSLEQITKRGITEEIALWIIDNATEKLTQEEVTIYQGIIIENNKNYLVRVIVNEMKTPALIIKHIKQVRLKNISYEN